MTNNTIWVLADDRAGNTGQALGVAEAFSSDVEIKNIRYTKAVKLPNCLRGASTIGITKESVQQIKEPFPDVAIAAGRRAAPLLRYIKKMSGGKTKIVQLMFPGVVGLSDFDLVVLPDHDGYKAEKQNIIRVTGTPHRITEERLKSEKEKWEGVFDAMPAPRLSLIVGGATKDMPFTPDMAQEMVDKTKELAEKLGVKSFLVTTSRRTGEQQEQIIKNALPEPFYFYGWGNTEVENPYFGYLALADYIVVTGDSMSMCSEACGSKAEVYIYAPENQIGPKHKRLHSQLYQRGFAKPLGGEVKEVEKTSERLNPAEVVANKIKELVG